MGWALGAFYKGVFYSSVSNVQISSQVTWKYPGVLLLQYLAVTETSAVFVSYDFCLLYESMR